METEKIIKLATLLHVKAEETKFLLLLSQLEKYENDNVLHFYILRLPSPGKH